MRILIKDIAAKCMMVQQAKKKKKEKRVKETKTLGRGLFQLVQKKQMMCSNC